MEEFGLFHLLNSLLHTPAKSTAKNGEAPPTKEEQPQETPPATGQALEKMQAPNACAAFFEAHEARAHKRR